MSPVHFNVVEHVLPCQYIREYPGATLDDQEDTLHLHIKQYKPKDQYSLKPGAVTIIGAQANAFPKVSLAGLTSAHQGCNLARSCMSLFGMSYISA